MKYLYTSTRNNKRKSKFWYRLE